MAGTAAGVDVAPGFVIPRAELVVRFSRSSGPGGQGVNTADSRVELRWDRDRDRYESVWWNATTVIE